MSEPASNKAIVIDTVPWDEPVDGTAVLDEGVEIIRRHLDAPAHVAPAIVLWSAVAHAQDQVDVLPPLIFSGPTNGCGKSLGLELTSYMVPRPLSAGNISQASAYRVVHAFCPTLLFDEADSYLVKDNAFRGILNSGHTRATAFVVRCVGDNHQPAKFSTWAPKALAVIGNFHHTFEDRAISIRLQRKPADSTVTRFSGQAKRESITALSVVCRKLARWVGDNAELIRQTRVEPHKAVSNHRLWDNLEPLMIIAQVAAGHWSQTSAEMASALAGQPSRSDRLGVLLLRDICSTFIDSCQPWLASSDLVDSLVAMEQRPWGEIRDGEPLSKIGLARFLSPFGIVPKQRKIDGATERGYAIDDFQNAFRRYRVGTETSRYGTESKNEQSGPPNASTRPSNNDNCNNDDDDRYRESRVEKKKRRRKPATPPRPFPSVEPGQSIPRPQSSNTKDLIGTESPQKQAVRDSVPNESVPDSVRQKLRHYGETDEEIARMTSVQAIALVEFFEFGGTGCS